MKIIISTDRTKALVEMPDGRTVGLYHDQGQVIDLIIALLVPYNIDIDITYSIYLSSIDDTVIIETDKIIAA